MENASIKEKIDWLYNDLNRATATFIYNPNEIRDIYNQIFELQDKCSHNFKNGKCIYCRKEQDVD